jgi:hypothetical protein
MKIESSCSDAPASSVRRYLMRSVTQTMREYDGTSTGIQNDIHTKD